MSTETTAFGYSENLPVEDPRSIVERTVSVAEPVGHDLLVRVEAVSVNPVDVKLRAGAPSDGFRVLGFDASGVVERVGDAVRMFEPGQEVYYAGNFMRPGSDQLLHLVDERLVGHKPRELSHADAASMPLSTLTAWESLFDRLGITSGSAGNLLVIGATGGVGSILIQLACMRAPSVRIIATASTPESAAWITALGADTTVNHHGDLVEQVLDAASDGVDWIFTAHSEGQIATYARILKPFGEIVAIDDGARDVSDLKPKCISWYWEFMFAVPIHAPQSTHQHEILEQVAGMVAAGQLLPTTSTVLSPISAETIREGHRLVETGRTVGKVVIAQSAPQA